MDRPGGHESVYSTDAISQNKRGGYEYWRYFWAQCRRHIFRQSHGEYYPIERPNRHLNRNGFYLVSRFTQCNKRAEVDLPNSGAGQNNFIERYRRQDACRFASVPVVLQRGGDRFGQGWDGLKGL